MMDAALMNQLLRAVSTGKFADNPEFVVISSLLDF